MQSNIINPWQWQDSIGFVQANSVVGIERLLVCVGQTSVDSEGVPMHEEDMHAQIQQCIDNLDVVLKEAGMSLSNVVRLNYYTTDVDRFLKPMMRYPIGCQKRAVNPQQRYSVWFG